VKSGNKRVEVTSVPPVRSLQWLRPGHVLLVLLYIANNALEIPFRLVQAWQRSSEELRCAS
jgi:hypothetical protein